MYTLIVIIKKNEDCWYLGHILIFIYFDNNNEIKMD